jgi:hypothetical protein
MQTRSHFTMPMTLNGYIYTVVLAQQRVTATTGIIYARLLRFIVFIYLLIRNFFHRACLHSNRLRVCIRTLRIVSAISASIFILRIAVVTCILNFE